MSADTQEKIKYGIRELCLIPIFWVLEPIARYLRRKMHVRQEIAGEVSISMDWTEITAPSPMRIDRRFQKVDIVVEGVEIIKPKCECDVEDDCNCEWGLLLPDGRVVFPEAQISDEFNNYYDLYVTSQCGNLIGFRSEIQLPQDRYYTRFRIRSAEPFKCSKITWHNYNLK